MVAPEVSTPAAAAVSWYACTICWPCSAVIMGPSWSPQPSRAARSAVLGTKPPR